MNRFSIVNDALPYRVEIDGLLGAGDTPARAICAALSAGGHIPAGLRDGTDAARHLFWSYEANPGWLELIEALTQNQFPQEASDGG